MKKGASTLFFKALAFFWSYLYTLNKLYALSYQKMG